MTSVQAAQAMARGINSVDPAIVCDLVPMADGGEGTTQTLVAALNGEWVETKCHDALERPAEARYGYIQDKQLAVIEVAEAAGLAQLRPDERDVWRATSRGVGELILSALDHGARQFIIGLGGSASNDAGAGMLTALGARFLDVDGEPVAPGAIGLATLDSVNLSGLDARLRSVSIRIASDVTNPLLGADGASAVYGPQKGATPLDIPALDAALARWAELIESVSSRHIRDLPGAGAAGGLGAAFAAVAPHARIESGVELVCDAVGLRPRIAAADWVFTGEGGIDGQTASGKTPWGVAQTATTEGVPTILFGGRISDDANELIGDAVVAVVPILRQVTDLPTALRDGAANLERATATTTRLITARCHR